MIKSSQAAVQGEHVGSLKGWITTRPGRAALAVFELLQLLVGKLWRQPVGAVDALDGVVLAGAEAKPPAIPRPRHVRGFASPQAALICPAVQYAESGRDLVWVGLDALFQVGQAALSPGVDGRLRKPAGAVHHVDRADGSSQATGMWCRLAGPAPLVVTSRSVRVPTIETLLSERIERCSMRYQRPEPPKSMQRQLLVGLSSCTYTVQMG